MKKTYLLIITILTILIIPNISWAFDFDYQINKKNQSYLLQILFTNNHSTFNALEGEIKIKNLDLINPTISTANSIIDFWVDKPIISSNTITFSGITPGGITQETGEILSINLQPINNLSEIIIESAQGTYFLNDGQGTASDFTQNTKTLTLPEIESEVPEIKDLYPPENFYPKVFSDPDIYNGQYILVFETKDKGSGIDYYQVAETKKITRDSTGKISPIRNSQWKKAESPYILKDQKLSSYILVEAIDKVGNKRLAIIYPQTKPLDNTKYYFSVIIIVLIIISSLIIWKLKTKCSRQKQK
jgi:competence protein ComGC